MELVQRFENTEESLRKNAQIWLSKTSDNLLNHYRFDRPYNLDNSKYLIVNAIAFMLCSNLDCDFELTDCRLEKMNIYIQKK